MTRSRCRVGASPRCVSRRGWPPEAGLEVTPEIADARQFEERLRHGIKEGSFYTLLVNPKYYQRACQELSRRFPVELVDFEGLFLDALRKVVDKAGAKWDAVVNADADTRRRPAGTSFMVLVKRAMPLVEQELCSRRASRCSSSMRACSHVTSRWTCSNGSGTRSAAATASRGSGSSCRATTRR